MSEPPAQTTLPRALYNAGLDIRFTAGDYEQIARVVTSMEASRLMILLTCNLAHVSLMRQDRAFQQVYGAAWAITLDSRPLWMYIRLRGGQRLPPHVTGADLLPRIMRHLRPGAHRIFVIAPSLVTGAQLCDRLHAAGFDRAAIGYLVPPLAFERDDRLNAEILGRIRAVRPTHLFLGLGAPKSELWLLRHGLDLDPMYAFCLGAALQYQAGEKSRAPRWMQRAGLEWTWRLCGEPCRLIPRYCGSAAALLHLIASDLGSLVRGHRRWQVP